jgi:hypothetical protein
VNKADRIRRRSAIKRARKARLRIAAGAVPQHQSTERTAPWRAMGISRRTYYRRLQPREIKLSNPQSPRALALDGTTSAPITFLNPSPETVPNINTELVSAKRTSEQGTAFVGVVPTVYEGVSGQNLDESAEPVPRYQLRAEHCQTTYVGAHSDRASMQWQRKPPEPEQSLLTMMQA